MPRSTKKGEKQKKAPRKRAGGGAAAPDASSAPEGAEAEVKHEGVSRRKSESESGEKVIMIVESPAKAKTISRYLQGKYDVVATMGHMKDLPKDRFGINVKKDFAPYFRVIPARAALLKEIKQRTKLTKKLVVATDPDREGESIGYHVASEVKGAAISRVEFHEITGQGIRDAMKKPRKIDMNKVDSQFTRRMLDRIVGYRLSPLLWRTVRSGLSAGRVQSVVVRLICERERKIKHFKPETYFRVVAALDVAGRPKAGFSAELFKVGGKRRKVTDRGEVDRITAQIKAGPLAVLSFKETERETRPPPPLITSTFQQAAMNRLGMTARHSMVVAQKLYEGVSLGKKGLLGLITYHRTDSVRLAPESIAAARKYISKQIGDEYVPDAPAVYKNRRNAQDAHEAIRPTDVTLAPDDVAEFLTDEQRKVYEVIWETFVASQMRPAVFKVRTIDVGLKAGGTPAPFELVARGEELKFPGFMKLTGSTSPSPFLPELAPGDDLTASKVDVEEKQTQPPARFTEARLVRELEHRGIARPSTYATILSTVVDRGYVVKKGKELYPTELGQIITDLLVKHFPDILEVDFTAKMEEQLDAIEEGGSEWKPIVRDFYDRFQPKVESTMEELKDMKKELTRPPIDVNCHMCGKPMVMRWSKFGKFLACSGYPECHAVRDIKEKDGEFSLIEIEVHPNPCPVCGSKVHARRGPYGKFWACVQFPKCRHTAPVTMGIKCPKGCGGDILRRRSRKGRMFFGCSSYPDCDFVSWGEPVMQPCPECGAKFLVKAQRKGEEIHKCMTKGCPHVHEPSEAAGTGSEASGGAGPAGSVPSA